MTRSRLLAAGAFLLLLLTAGGSSALLRLALPPERLARDIPVLLSRRLGREVRLGEVSVGFWRGVTLQDLALSQRPDFHQGTFLSMKRAVAHLSLPDLFRRRLAVQDLLLDSPSLDLGNSSPSDAHHVLTWDQASVFLGDCLTIHNGAFTWTGRRSPLAFTAHDVDLEFRSPALTSPASFLLSARGEIDGGRPIPLSWTASLKMDLPSDDLRMNVERASLFTDGAALDVKGTATREENPRLDLSLSLEAFHARALTPFVDLSPFLADMQAEGVLQFKGLLDNLRSSGELTVSLPGVTLDLETTLSWLEASRGRRLSFDVRPRSIQLRRSEMTPAVRDVFLSAKGEEAFPEDTWMDEPGEARSYEILFNDPFPSRNGWERLAAALDLALRDIAGN